MTAGGKALDLELARTVFRQGELRLGTQLTLALAADQRAITLTGVFIAAATAAVGVGIGFLGAATPNFPIGAGGLVMGAMLLRAAYDCMQSARPIKFRVVGNRPDNWWEDGVESQICSALWLNYRRNFAVERLSALHQRANILANLSANLGIYL